MNAISLLKQQADLAFGDLCMALEGIDEPLSWATVTLKESEYLHTDGSTLMTVQHIAGAKRMYGSVAFRNGETRWRDCAQLFDAVGTNWSKTVQDLHDAHAYWLSTWADLTDADLESERENIRGRMWPAWRVISAMANHDQYHAGQIEILKVTLQPTSTPPATNAEDIRQCCQELPHW